MYSYDTHMLFVYTCMSSVCHLYVLVCHPHVTGMYSYVIRLSLVCTCMSSVCHSYFTRMYSCVTVCNPYVLVCYLYVTCLWFYHEPVMLTTDNKLKINVKDSLISKEK